MQRQVASTLTLSQRQNSRVAAGFIWTLGQLAIDYGITHRREVIEGEGWCVKTGQNGLHVWSKDRIGLVGKSYCHFRARVYSELCKAQLL